jgi:outer membrane lipoprotein-sorting protein
MTAPHLNHQQINKWMSGQKSRRVLAVLITLAGILLVGVVFAVLSGRGDEAPPQPHELADRMAARLERLDSVTGRLLMVSGAVVVEQELWVERPRLLRMEVEAGPPAFGPLGENQKTTLVLNETDAWFYNPNLNLVTVTDRSSYVPEEGLGPGGSLLESMPEEVLSLLRNSREIQIIGPDEVAGRSALRVQILANRADNVFNARTLNVLLDREFYYPLAIESNGERGSGFLMRFQWVRFNEAIDPATFIFVPPPGSVVSRIPN